MVAKDLKDITRINLLYDFYGGLLSPRQEEVMKLYHEENYSLAEIARDFGISRQGVHDALKNGEQALERYESKLGLVARFRKNEEAIRNIDSMLDELICSKSDEAGKGQGLQDNKDRTIKELKKIKEVIDNLEE